MEYIVAILHTYSRNTWVCTYGNMVSLNTVNYICDSKSCFKDPVSHRHTLFNSIFDLLKYC